MRKILSMLVLVSLALPAYAQSSGGGDQAVLKRLIEKKEAEVTQMLAQVSYQKGQLAELRVRIEAARAAKSRAKAIAIPAILVGSAIFIASSYKLATERFDGWSGWLNLKAIPKAFYTLAAGTGAATAGGVGYYLYVRTEKLGELEETVSQAEAVLAAAEEKLEAEREELRVLKDAAGE